MSDQENPPLFEKIIYENEIKGYQLRMVLSEYREVLYIHIRKYFLSFEGEYVASKEGVSFPAEIDNIYNLLEGLIELSSYEESRIAVLKFFSDKIPDLNLPS